MSKTSCDVILDLLPLYADGACSEGSRKLVEEHLAGCDACRAALQAMKTELPPGGPAAPEEPAAEPAAALKKGFRRILRYWVISLAVIVFLVIPLGYLTWNQIRGCGVCFTNIHEISIADAYLQALKKSDYQKSFRYMDLEWVRKNFQKDGFSESTMADFDNDCLNSYTAASSALQEAGGVQEFHFLSSTNQGDCFELIYSVLIDGEKHITNITVSDQGIQSMSDDEDLSGVIIQLNLWTENLWEKYSGCYFDRNSGTYIYNNDKKMEQ